MNKLDASQGEPAPALISKRATGLTDWRGDTLARMRQLILQAVALNSAGKANPAKGAR